jgi:hypothetical protein
VARPANRATTVPETPYDSEPAPVDFAGEAPTDVDALAEAEGLAEATTLAAAA